MIVISSPMKRDFFVETLENYNENGVTFKKVDEKGIKLYFETTTEDEEAAVRIAKDVMKATDIGAVLYFQVTVE
ncbi:hypothetical protein [Listeria newyorkensis]|uniref:Uncharacterized protein n=1 Tax=Listeria newyorkensis TaxID=1497681 RepID=A0A841YVP9_9LIST|nr:hypothetical protein [Listeria newyorkensis]MBC1457368.1 hypothetical protein [Listeria newyorkensis]